MRRRKRHSEVEAASFGGFVDVVCNLIGGLLLIAIISALASRNPVFNVFSPIEDVSSEDAVSHKFAVTEKGIYPMDQPEALAKLVAESKKRPDAKVVLVRTRFFRWMLYRDPGLLACEIRTKPPPLTDANVSTIISDTVLKPHIPGTQSNYFAYFMVSPSDEAFRLFRMARKALWKEGIRVGWAPRDPRKKLVFGGHGDGVRMRPQD